MADHLRECNSGELRIDPKTFTTTWCVRCSQPGCDLAGFAKDDLMAARNATWRDRFFNAEQADIALPKFALIAKLDFPDMLAKAMRLEISEQKGDWSVPEIPITDGRIVRADPDTAEQVDEAIRALAAGPHRHEEDEDDEFVAPEEYDEPDSPDHHSPVSEPPSEPPPETPEESATSEDDRGPAPPARKAQSKPRERNTPDRGEVMIGGGPVEVRREPPTPETDPWEPPPKPEHRVVKAGAKIRFGSGGAAKVLDD